MRRQVLLLLAGAAATWAGIAWAQQPQLPVIGYLSAFGQNDRSYLVDAFRRGLNEAGYIEGRNVAIEYRFAEKQVERLPALAADLVGRDVDVIAAIGGAHTIRAAKGATTSIPIVFGYSGDPVEAGWVESLSRPGGNATGINFFAALVNARALGLLHDLLPDVKLVALLTNPASPESERGLRESEEAARSLGLQMLVVRASTASEIDAAFAAIKLQGAGALLISADPFFTTWRQQIVTLAARNAVPAMYPNPEYTAVGGLMSYGNDIADVYRRIGRYVGRILDGASPSDLPVEQAIKFEFVINLKTAGELGITIPPNLLAIADEVIE